MFQFDEKFQETDLSIIKEKLERNYTIKPGDIFNIKVNTNKGELLIDPNNELAQLYRTSGGNNFRNDFRQYDYIVQVDGSVLLPIIGKFHIEGFSMFEAEKELSKVYDEIYKDSFVKLQIKNRRVYVIGGNGGNVVSLPNENTNLFEVIATIGGVPPLSDVSNVKLLRGTEVFQINLSKISSILATDMEVKPGDVIYIQPNRRVWVQSLRDLTPTISLLSSIITLWVLVVNRF